MTTTQPQQEPAPWTRQQMRDHWTLTKLHYWIPLPKWEADQAIDLIAGVVPHRPSTVALEMLYGECIQLPPTTENEFVVLKVDTIREKLRIAAHAYGKEELSPEEWLSFAGSLGIAPSWRQLGIESGLLTDGQPEPAAKVKAVERSITKQQVINAFDGLHFKDRNGWNNALSDVPKWIETCRMVPGRKGDNSMSATWSPVLIAAALLDKGISIRKLDAVFLKLPEWADEWREKSASDRD
ncbi:MAG: hypothetical protein Q7T21_15785 [Gallionella sp.]|nr:hypothetical protein [Gallionella sp.]